MPEGGGAPLLIDGYALQERVLASPLVAQMLKGLAPLGLVLLGLRFQFDFLLVLFCSQRFVDLDLFGHGSQLRAAGAYGLNA